VAEAACTIAAFIASYVGFALLALRQRAHWSAVAAGREASLPPEGLRGRWLWSGSAAVAAGFLLCLLGQGPSFGCLLGVLMLSCAAFAVTFTLTWRPSWLRLVRRLC
jgi:hypothetical protein